MARPRSIREALSLSLEELAPYGDFGGVTIAQIPDDYPSSEIDNLLATQLRDDPRTYKEFNVTSLGSLARIIVSGKNSRLVSRAQVVYDNYKRWHEEKTASLTFEEPHSECTIL